MGEEKADNVKSPQHEKSAVAKTLETPLKEGDRWFAVAEKWWQLWKEYTQYDQPAGEEVWDAGRRPGPIDNESLKGNYKLSLREGLVEGNDFVLVPESVWKKILKWYGGGPEFARKVISQGGIQKTQLVDLYPVMLRFCWVDNKSKTGEPDMENVSGLAVNREKTCGDIVEQFTKDVTDEKTTDPEVRIWHIPREEEVKSDSGEKTWKLMKRIDLLKPMHEWNFPPGELLMLEKKSDASSKWVRNAIKQNWEDFEVGDVIDCKDLSKKWYEAEILNLRDTEIYVHYINWPAKWDEWIPKNNRERLAKQSTHTNGPHRKPKQSSYYSGGYSSRYSHSYYSNEKGVPAERGAVGLRNLGNTCFMNSTLQCLSATPILSHFFISGEYASQINRDNPLGRGGKIAQEWGNLVKDLWSGDYRTVAPRALKEEIGNFAPRFMGYAQQDSSELLGFLLDGLHEDLNRILKKPPTDKVEGEGQPDEEVARLAWDTYRLRNDSIIVDTMQGQLKSTVVCPDCSYVSVTFDPFMFLSVPFPSIRNKTQVVTVMFSDPKKPVTVFGPKVDKTGSILSLKNALSELCGVKASNLAICEIWNKRIYKLFKDDQNNSEIRQNDVIWAFELPEFLIKGSTPKATSVSYCRILQLYEHPNPNYRPGLSYTKPMSLDEFGIPLVVKVPRQTSATGIRKRIREVVRPLVVGEDSMEIDGGEPSDPYRIIKLDRQGRTCYECGHLKNCDGCELTEGDQIVENDTVSFALVWTDKKKMRHSHYTEQQVHPSAPQETSSRGGYRVPKDPEIDLADCINAFTLKEKLSEQDAWYCRKCKAHRRATKKFDLWKVPDILVISLKRFTYTRTYRDRINALVNFPISGLDLSPWIINPGHGPAIYDLYAVSNHMGGMGGGHYNAYAQNLIDGKWYCLDDSSVSELRDPQQCVSSSAYVLYFKKRGVDQKVQKGVPAVEEDPELSADEEEETPNPSQLKTI